MGAVMTTQTAAPAPGPVRVTHTAVSDAGTPARTPRLKGMRTMPAVAGLVYTASWVIGLTVSPSSTNVRSTGAEVVAGYAGHQAAGVTQFLLTEGTASLALAVVAVAVGRAGLRAGVGRTARLTMGAGLAAAATALVQCALGLYLVMSAVPADHIGAAAAVSDTLSRLDGVKMFVLATMAAAGTVMARQTGLLPRWLRWTGVALIVAIIASGIGYALLNNTFALAAWASLPLLLVWVTGAGIAAGRRAK
jgi:hypothetical protein